MSGHSYAQRTKVTVSKSRAEIERLVKRHGSTSFGIMEMEGRVMVAFGMEGRNVRFVCDLPDSEQETRARYRQLLLTIRGKLESWKEGIETFDDAFMSQIVTPAGGTVGDQVRTNIRLQYERNDGAIPLLEGPSL